MSTNIENWPDEGFPEHWTRDDIARDLHARYHCQEGNLLGRDECEWEGCDAFDAITHTLAATRIGAEPSNQQDTVDTARNPVAQPTPPTTQP